MKKLIPYILALLLLAGCQSPLQDSSVGGNQEGLLDRKTLQNTAFAHAGVNETDVRDLDEDYEKRGSVTVYELDFEVKGAEYEYELNAKTGEILRSSTDGRPVPVQPAADVTVPVSTTLTEEDAKRIALEDAGLNEGAVKSFSIELDWGDGVYEIEFFVKGIEYEYEIDIYTGEIFKAEKDRD